MNSGAEKTGAEEQRNSTRSAAGEISNKLGGGNTGGDNIYGDATMMSSSSDVVGGTIYWLAPERLAPIYKLFLDESTRTRDEWNVVGSGLTKAADVYSFSLTVWEILTGEHLFQDKDSFEVGLLVLTESLRPDLKVLDRILTGHSTSNQDIFNLKSLLRAGWAPHPSLRPDMRQMQHDLNKAYDKEHAAATKRSERLALRSMSASTKNSNHSVR